MKKKLPSKDIYSSGSFRFEGYLGEATDRISDRRIRSRYAKENIFPETVEAHRKRVDDSIHPKPGVGMWQGEFWGKQVLSAVGAAQYYQDQDLKEFLQKSAHEILATQDPDGYIGTYSNKDQMGPRNWNVWGRKYTLWGLVDIAVLTGDQALVDGAEKMLQHMLTQLGPGKESIRQTGQLVGLPSMSILTPVVKLYKLTDKPEFLEFAKYIVQEFDSVPDGPPMIFKNGLEGTPIHQWFPNPEDWAKSYEFISCVEGMLELYDVTGNQDYLTASQNIHKALIEWERSPVGSVSFNDKFIGSRGVKNLVAEICDAIYWNRFSFKLFLLTGNVSYVDEIERTVYNSLVVGMSPEGTWGLRRLRLSHEHIPAHLQCRLNHHHCCVTNLPRGFFQAAETQVMSGPDRVLVNLYSPGFGRTTLPSGRPVGLSFSGDYPFESRSRLSLTLEQAEPFALVFRQPWWSTGLELFVNGKAVETQEKDRWVTVSRTWSSCDQVEIHFGQSLHWEFFEDDLLGPDDPAVKFTEEKWPTFGYILTIGGGGGQRSRLTPDQLRPHNKAVAFFMGPLALARDIRLGDSEIFRTLPKTWDRKTVPEVKEIDPPSGVRHAFQLTFPSGETMNFVDYASAGSTRDEKSEFNTWVEIE